MDPVDWLTVFSIVAVYLGFAGTWGSLLRPDRRSWLSGWYFLFLLLPASLALPLPSPWREVIWAAGLALVMLYASRPGKLPDWLWQGRFTCCYFGTLMFLILIWATVGGQPWLWLQLGLPAGAAGLISWTRTLAQGWASGLV